MEESFSVKKLYQFSINRLPNKKQPISSGPVALLFGAGTFVLLSASIATAQIAESDRVKARVDDSKLTTDDREQQLLRRLQNRPFAGEPGGAGFKEGGRMRFERDEEVLPQPSRVDEVVPEKNRQTQTGGMTPPGDQGKAAIVRSRRPVGVEPEQELTEELNDIQTRSLNKQEKEKDLDNRQAPSRDTPTKQNGREHRRNAANNLIKPETDLATDESDSEESKTSSSTDKRLEKNRPQQSKNSDQVNKEPEDINVIDSETAVDTYESLEESTETAHLSRGGSHNQHFGQTVGKHRPSTTRSRQVDLNDNENTNSKGTDDEPGVTDSQTTANQIQQLEALKENLKLQRELATNQGKMTELSTELEDTKERLITAEKQVEELSQRLQHVGDRRTFNSDTLSQRGSQSDLEYDQSRLNQDRGSIDSGDMGPVTIDGRGGSRGYEYNGSEVSRNRGGDSRINEMRGSGSSQSLRRSGNESDLSSRDRYLDEAFNDRSPSSPGLEIPRQIESETNTPLVSVIGEDVNLRSGPDKSYPSVMRLRKGERIVVEEQSAEWLQIIAPNGARAWIERSATNFDAIARGERTTVSAPVDAPADYRSRRAPPRMSVEDRALELIRRGR